MRTAALPHYLEVLLPFVFVTTGLKAVRVEPQSGLHLNSHPDVMSFNLKFPLSLMCIEFPGSRSTCSKSTQTCGEHARFTHERPGWESNPQPCVKKFIMLFIVYQEVVGLILTFLQCATMCSLWSVLLNGSSWRVYISLVTSVLHKVIDWLVCVAYLQVIPLAAQPNCSALSSVPTCQCNQ